ncbi:mechanosensitive ion channel domain-containing protein [Breoghania sp. L-A4]|uniref:mechanosensitive ion channel family protein n=1 Tax=Breoghania sp. L-A4 TaxID=2304600 RepID=UPI000E35C3AE|nr:hypothetical protein D1F64_03770 [Breoghania sp. L-A4]
METWTDFLAAIETTLRHVFLSVRALGQPSGLLQILILISAFALAHFGAEFVEPRFERWVRSIETSMKRLRFLILVLRRLRLIFFVILVWIAVLAMRSVAWPSWSYLLLVVGNLSAVWLVISISSRVIRNPLAARTVALGAWIFAALSILDLMPFAVRVMDAAAITVGDLRISLLLVIKAVVTLSILLWGAAYLSRVTERRVAQVEDMSPSMRVLAGKFVRIGLFTTAFVMGLQSIGFDLTTITVFSGAVGIGLGFGLQKVVSNLVSGVILLLDKSIKPGDVITLGETYGAITSLGRATSRWSPATAGNT